ncbi:thymidine kinase [Sedimentitalea arenosa]|uniref:Thymidine kinase n=1 Tax=Sedimentitalea arenosa TaxID=2798803 RepID=A0A8J7LQJ9_9RHOB|nr:thymidine kinase [Arenibacterium arenosum]MBJ6370903.1 thymidine kinase [Arenibacterium arenosum]
MAKLFFNYSTMNAGKSTVLLQASHNYREHGMQTYLLTARVDDRAGPGRIASRIGIGSDADVFAPGDDLFAMVQDRLAQGPVSCVFVDEAQFLEKAQVWQLARVVDDLNLPVLCYGLRVDFRGELFPGSAALLAIADEIREVRTICRCGRKATMVIRQDAEGRALRDGAQVQIGGNETYVSLCRRHWRDAVGDRPQTQGTED